MSKKINYFHGVINGNYHPGSLIKITYTDSTMADTFSSGHILAYPTSQGLPFNFIDSDQELWVIKILPILNKIGIPVDSPNLKELMVKLLNNSYIECESINQELPAESWAFCDLSSCCYIILSYNKELVVNINDDDKLVDEMPDMSNIEALHELKTTIEQEEKILSFNPKHSQYLELIKESMALESKDSYRHFFGILLSWLIINTERCETAIRLFTENGDVSNTEEYSSSVVRDTRFSLLEGNIKRFLFQASSMEDQGQIWAVLNFTMCLLELLTENEDNPDILNDFMGLFPVIDADEQKKSIYTISPIQYSPQFTYAFLCIPSQFRYKFKSCFKQLLHEFFHYAPTDAREKRTLVLLQMFSYSILGKNASEETIDLIVQYLLSHYKRLGHNSLLFHDSMSLISTMRFILNRADIPEYLAKQGYPISDVLNFPDRTKQTQLFIEYTFFLREIRSDISMLSLIYSDSTESVKKNVLKDYIQLMANEPEWATPDVEDIELEPILRLGYMIDWIKKTFHFNKQHDAKEIIDTLKNECEDYKLKAKYDNLKAYYQAYEEKEKKVIDIHEEILSALSAQWANNKYINNIKNSDFWNQFLNLYNDECFKTNLEFDYGIKLLLMAYPYFLELL